MNIVRSISALFLASALIVHPSANAQLQVIGDGGPGPVKAQHLTAELVSLAPDIAPGGTLQVGLLLTLEEHWHVYWINAGDSGEPPKVTWTLPEGITAGAMQFPIPSRLDAIVNWLVCREVCIPGKAHLGLNLTVNPAAATPTQPVGALGEALTL